VKEWISITVVEVVSGAGGAVSASRTFVVAVANGV
jgi:hypothetical protein